MKPVEFGWAVFLSLPVGVGVWLAVLKTSGGRSGLLAMGAGLGATLLVFLVVVGGVIDWSDDSE